MTLLLRFSYCSCVCCEQCVVPILGVDFLSISCIHVDITYNP